YLLVECVDQQCRQVFRARSARVAGLALLETAVHRRLAATDLVIALCLGHRAPAILSTPGRRGRHLPRLLKRGSAAYRNDEKISIINYYYSTDRHRCRTQQPRKRQLDG